MLLADAEVDLSTVVHIRVDPFLHLLARLVCMNLLIGLPGMPCDQFGLWRLYLAEWPLSMITAQARSRLPCPCCPLRA